MHSYFVCKQTTEKKDDRITKYAEKMKQQLFKKFSHKNSFTL